ncbi:hypothetical protein FB451DRAFT_1286364 [Mycena latifolia]|nr:hypothetical protein FB451DRAFT_1286364 [Mycena latifolia]
MARRRLGLPLLLLLCLSARAEDKPCTGRNAGKYYDLNRLQIGKDYTLTTPGGNELVLSACKSVSHETWGLKVQDPGSQINTTLSFSGRAGHPHLTLSGGSKCVDSNGGTLEHMRGSTEIEFVCDPSAGAGGPRLVAQLPPGGPDEESVCAWFVEWRTTAACPTSEGTTFGGIVWFLFLTTLIILLLYLTIGTLYNYFILHLSGTDALPRFSLAGMLYHGREALEMAGDWWAGERPCPHSRGPRGPVGLGGPGGFRSAPDVERQAFLDPDDNADEPGIRRGGNPNGGLNANGGANPFIRTRKEPYPQANAQTNAQRTGMNPASHQAQVMAPPPPTSPGLHNSTAAPGAMGMPMPIPVPQPSVGGLNPASHQAQLMAGLPVPQLEQQQQQNANAPQPVPARRDTAPNLGRRDTAQTFSVGDDEGEEGDEDAPEIEIADMRDGGDIRL